MRLNTKGGSVVIDGKDECRMTEGSVLLVDGKGARNAETSQEVLKTKEKTDLTTTYKRMYNSSQRCAREDNVSPELQEEKMHYKTCKNLEDARRKKTRL